MAKQSLSWDEQKKKEVEPKTAQANPFDEFEDAPAQEPGQNNPFDEFEDAPAAGGEFPAERDPESDLSWMTAGTRESIPKLFDYHTLEGIKTSALDVPVISNLASGIKSVAAEVTSDGNPADYILRKYKEQAQVRKTLEDSQKLPEVARITEQNLADQGLYKDDNLLKNLRDAYYRGRDDYQQHKAEAFSNAPVASLLTSLGTGAAMYGAAQAPLAAAQKAAETERYGRLLNMLTPRTSALPETAGPGLKTMVNAAEAAKYGAVTGFDASKGRLSDGFEGVTQIAEDTAQGATVGGLMGGGLTAGGLAIGSLGKKVKDIGKTGYDFTKQTGKDFSGPNVDEHIAKLSNELRDVMLTSRGNLESKIKTIEEAVNQVDNKQAFQTLVNLRDELAARRINSQIRPDIDADRQTLLKYLDGVIDSRGRALTEAAEAGAEKVGKAIVKGQAVDGTSLAQAQAKADSEVAEAAARQNILTPDEPITDIQKTIEIPEINGRQVFTQKSDLVQGQPEGSIQRLGDEMLPEPVATQIKTKDITKFTPSEVETKVVDNRPVTQAVDITTGKPISTVVGKPLPQNEHDIQKMSSQDIKDTLEYIKDRFTTDGKNLQIKNPQLIEEMTNFTRIVRDGLADKESQIYRTMLGKDEVAPNISQLKQQLADFTKYTDNLGLAAGAGENLSPKDLANAQQLGIFKNIMDTSSTGELRLQQILEGIRETDPALANKYTDLINRSREFKSSSRTLTPQMEEATGGGFSRQGFLKGAAGATGPTPVLQKLGSKVAKVETEMGEFIAEKTRAPKEWFEGFANDLRQRYPNQLAAIEAQKQLMKAATSAPAQRAAIMKNLYSQPGIKVMLDSLYEAGTSVGGGLLDYATSKDETPLE